MPDSGRILSACLLAGTLALILWRPRGMSEATGASMGALIALATRLVSPHDLWQIVRQTTNVLLFLLGMMMLTGIVEQNGAFEALATLAARAARGSGRLLLLNVFILGTLITALLSLDVTIIILTPLVYTVVDRLGIDSVPYLFACVFVANTASLFFPMSNLTNILMSNLLHLTFLHFAAVMAIPNVAALAVNIGMFFLLFRDRIPPQFTLHATNIRRPPGFTPAAIALTTVLVGLFVFGLADRPLAIPALAGAAALGAVAIARRSVALTRVRHAVAWSLFPFVVAMFVVIRGVERAWLAQSLPFPAHAGLGTLLGFAFGTAALANLLNNIPIAVAMIGVLQGASGSVAQEIRFATLVGTNIGPSVITVGSLATMLWLAIVRRRGVDVTGAQYLRVGLATTPLMVAAATVALWFDLMLSGR